MDVVKTRSFCQTVNSVDKVLCECAHSFAQRFLNAKNLCSVRVPKLSCCSLKWSVHCVTRLGAVQCAGAVIDGQVKIITDPK